MDNFSFKCDGNKNRALFDRFLMISCVTVHSMHLVKNQLLAVKVSEKMN